MLPVIDKELEQAHVKEERKIRFTEFVKAQKASGSKGMANACLHSTGYRDSYGKVVFAVGLHDNRWILPAGENGKALLYTKQSDAESYAKELQKILRGNGYPFSRTWVLNVAVRTDKGSPYSKIKAPRQSFESDDRFLICMKVR